MQTISNANSDISANIDDQAMHPDIKLNLFGGHNLREDEADERSIFIFIFI